MKGKQTKREQAFDKFGDDFLEQFWGKSWTYIKTVVDVLREPVLILDKDLRVMTANDAFYTTFQVEKNDTERNIVYELGNGQWNIPKLKTLLENILPQNTFFKGFEVTHDFPAIGRKVIILNARQIHVQNDDSFPQIILLAMEDVTEMMVVAEMLGNHAKEIGSKLVERTSKLEARITKLQTEVKKLKKDESKKS